MTPPIRLFLAVALTLALSPDGSAQLSHITLIQNNYVYTNRSTGGSTSDWSHSFLVEGENRRRKAGYFGQHLRKYLQSDTTAMRYMNQYAAKQTFKLATSVSTVVFFSIFGISNLAQKNTPENPDPPTVNSGFLYASIGTLFLNLIIRLTPPKSIFKAVDSYNKSIGKADTGFAGFDLGVQDVGPSRQIALGAKFNF